MSAQKDHDDAAGGGAGGSSGSEQADERSDFESWLRRAARVPDGPRPVALPQQGQVIADKYRIEELLGRGGMGAVFRATHTVSGKAVAVKWMLRPASDERAAQRFTREARAAGRIDHPNVVDVYDLGQEGDAGYLVMELLRGESLRTRLARGPLAPTEAVDLLLPALRGVAAAHREGVVHRDLKPDNVFLCRGPDGSLREAKVLDFGISSITTPDYDSQTSLTKEGTVLGTPAYMSPEQLHSSKDADTLADVYALGVILYEALTGKPPFVADSYSALVLAIVNEAPKPLRALRPEIPAALEAVVLHAIHKDKTARPKSVEALIAALAPFASTPSAGSGEHPSRELQRATLPSMKRRGGVWLAATVLALAAITWWFARSASNPSIGPAVTVEAAATLPPPSSPSPSPSPSPNPIPNPIPIPTPAPTPVPTPTPLPRRAEKTPHPRALAPSPTPPAAPKPAAARSGRISIDDL